MQLEELRRGQDNRQINAVGYVGYGLVNPPPELDPSPGAYQIKDSIKAEFMEVFNNGPGQIAGSFRNPDHGYAFRIKEISHGTPSLACRKRETPEN